MGGVVQQSNFGNYPMVQMAQAPVVETWVVPSTRAPGGHISEANGHGPAPHLCRGRVQTRAPGNRHGRRDPRRVEAKHTRAHVIGPRHKSLKPPFIFGDKRHRGRFVQAPHHQRTRPFRQGVRDAAGRIAEKAEGQIPAQAEAAGFRDQDRKAPGHNVRLFGRCPRGRGLFLMPQHPIFPFITTTPTQKPTLQNLQSAQSNAAENYPTLHMGEGPKGGVGGRAQGDLCRVQRCEREGGSLFHQRTVLPRLPTPQGASAGFPHRAD